MPRLQWLSLLLGQTGKQAFHGVNPGDGGANTLSESVPTEAGATCTLSVYARARGARRGSSTQNPKPVRKGTPHG